MPTIDESIERAVEAYGWKPGDNHTRMRAAISAFLADVPVSEGMARAGLNAYHSGEHVLGIYPEMCAKLAEEIRNV